MKKLIACSLAIALAFAFGCKKKEEEKKDAPVAKKYARYRVIVHKEKELKTWLATLEKAESVDLLGEEKVTVKEKRGELTYAVQKGKLADDKVGYIDNKHLADKPIVFSEDTKALDRPTTGSRVHATLEKGSIAFITGEKGNWVQVYAGEVKPKLWVVDKWVNGGYTADEKVIQDAKDYEVILSLLREKKPEKEKDAKEKLEQLSKTSSFFAELAGKKLAELSAPKDEDQPKEGVTKDLGGDLSKEAPGAMDSGK